MRDFKQYSKTFESVIDRYGHYAEAAHHFDGETYEPERDHARLTGQMARVFEVMQGGCWYSLAEVARRAQVPASTVGSRIRDFRKKRFGKWRVKSCCVRKGFWLYRLLPPLPEKQMGLELAKLDDHILEGLRKQGGGR